jgi:hypothetical protein
MNITYESTLAMYEDMLQDIIYIIVHKQNIDEDEEYNFNFSNMLMWLIDSFDTHVTGPNLMYGKWVVDVLVEYEEISFEDFMAKAVSEHAITRADFLGLYRCCISELHPDSEKAVKITVQLLAKDYQQNVTQYSGKPVEKILENEDLFRLMTTFLHD